MLGDGDRQQRKLLDLVAYRLADRDQFALAEGMAALAASRPVDDHLVDRRGQQQLAAAAPVAGLGALLAPRRILAAPRQLPRRISARRPRRVTRVLRQLTLEPVHSRRQPLDVSLQPLVLHRQRQQHLHDRIPARLIDRLSLGPLHTPRFDKPQLCLSEKLTPACCFWAARGGWS